MSLLQKLMKNSSLAHTNLLSESDIYNTKDVVSTSIPAINIALSGSIDGGLSPGILQITGPSKHFKSAFTLLIASAYLKKYKDGVILFYDSEFGTPDSYFSSLDIDKARVVHCPVTNVEEFKNDIMQQLSNIERGERVCIVVDSIGNLASKKEVDDAIDGKSTQDMTRAKALKSLGRMVTPHLTLKDIPMIVVNHVYKEMGLFPKDIVSGGQGLYLSSDNIWIIGRQQEKDGTQVSGYNFIINIEKSRHVREKTKIPINVTFNGGLSKWSGLFEIALEGGLLKEVSKGWYSVSPSFETTDFTSTGKYRRNDIENNSSFWSNAIKAVEFNEYINKRYNMSSRGLMNEDNGI